MAPNAVLLAGSYLLGPGFAVGTGTMVSPSAVVLGPVPAFPLLAALPAEGTPPAWASALVAVPVLAGLVAAVLVVRRFPAYELGTGAVRGLGSGVVGGVCVTLLVALAGGAVGPGRMADLGADLVPTFVAATVAMGLGGLVGGVAATWWGRRGRASCTGQAEGSAADLRACPSLSACRPPPARLVVLVSGAGTNLQALLDACADPAYGAQVVAVGADRDGIEGLARAERAGVPTFVHRVKDHASREDWDAALTASVREHAPDLVVLAGFMKLAGDTFLAAFGGRTVNTHPALSPSFPGMQGPADALAYGVKVTGATLFVVDAGVDTGPIVAQVAVPVEDDDDVETLHERIKVAERSMLVDDRRPDGAGGLHRPRPQGALRRGPLVRLAAHDWRRWDTTRE